MADLITANAFTMVDMIVLLFFGVFAGFAFSQGGK